MLNLFIQFMKYLLNRMKQTIDGERDEIKNLYLSSKSFNMDHPQQMNNRNNRFWSFIHTHSLLFFLNIISLLRSDSTSNIRQSNDMIGSFKSSNYPDKSFKVFSPAEPIYNGHSNNSDYLKLYQYSLVYT